MTNEQQIIEKLKRIGPLFESTNMAGEKRVAELVWVSQVIGHINNDMGVFD